MFKNTHPHFCSIKFFQNTIFKSTGAREIGLRPNWWHVGVCGPHLPLHTVGRYLEQAMEKVATKETSDRIEFLKDGLVQVVITSALIEASESKKPEEMRKLLDFNKEMQKKHGYWCNTGISTMKSRGVIGREVDLNGM